MKLPKNGKKADVDLKAIDDWVAGVRDAVKSLPIVSKIMKGMGSPSYKTIYVPSKFNRWAEILREKNPFYKHEFSTISDVYRAALYIGLRIMHGYCSPGLPENSEAHMINASLRVMEEDYVNFQHVHHATNIIQNLVRFRRAGTISPDTFDKRLSDVMDFVPLKLRKFVEENRKRIEAGEKVVDLYQAETSTWGGARENAGRKSFS